MNKTEVKLDYSLCEETAVGLPVIIVAAGSSSRMGQNKQLLELGGIPVIARTLLRFENCSKIKNIILVVRDNQDFRYNMRWRKPSGICAERFFEAG